jgi:hypothetical protein
VGILNHLEPSMHQAISPPSPHPLLPQPPSPPAAERKPTPRRGMSRHTRHWPTRLMTSKAGAAKAADDTPAAQAGQGEAAAETGADTSAVQTGDDTSASQTGEGGLEDRASRHSSDKASRHFSGPCPHPSASLRSSARLRSVASPQLLVHHPRACVVVFPIPALLPCLLFPCPAPRTRRC